jgi:hypothetical protein
MNQSAWITWIVVYALMTALIVGHGAYAQNEPPLPMGLGKAAPAEPALPAGLGSGETPQEPALPEGLGAEPEVFEVREAETSQPGLPFELSGFGEARVGIRTQDDPHEKQVSIGEARFQLQIEKAWEQASIRLTTDFLYDPVLDRHAIRLEDGEGFLDLREASLLLRPTAFMDIKIGRQILTWGTGDLLFINDLFPKDFNSFFIGRDPEYLKAPSDALKMALFSPLVNLDVIYTPRFDADRFIDGRRISFFNASLGRLTGRDAVVRTDKPDTWFHDSEIAWRLYKNVGGYELAVYGYHGFWKSPAGIDPLSGRAIFPALSVYGASIRGAIAQGIGNLEFGYYDSEDDRSGDDPFIRNSELRLLLGYEREVAQDFTVGMQYYLEHMLHHAAFQRALPPGSPGADTNRHLLTVRLTKLLWRQNLQLSLFTFYSPSDQDAYLRPKIHYKIDDHWSAEIGANIFGGKNQHTFFGQFKKNSNVYTGVRYSF